MYFVNERWLGGMLTNFKTIQSRIARLKEIETMQEDGTFDVLPKKEVINLKKELEKLQKNLGGIKEMKRIPDAIFIVDPKKERICVQEAHALGITLIGIADTNCDPDELDYVIPGNDDAIRAVNLIVSKMADAVIEANQGEEAVAADAEEVAEEAFFKIILKYYNLEESKMAAITAAMVKELRESTGAGMMECKKALTETDGDMEAAVDVLRKSGAAKVEKKAGRIAAEGITRVASEGNTAVVVEVNSETDFVAKNAVFQEFVQNVADKALKASVDKAGDGEDVCAILDMKSELEEKTIVIGEKLSLRRFEKLTGDCVASYVHGGGRIGVLVAAEGATGDAVKEALTNIAMQIAAMNPQYISRNDMSAEELTKLR